MSNFKQKVKKHFPQLSSGLKKVGKYLLENPQSFAMLPANQVGIDIGVSETTVIRFCYALGYSGYTELQKEVREKLILSRSSLQEYQADKVEMASKPNFFAKAMQKDQSYIQRVIEQISEKELNLAVQRLVGCNDILVTGLRTSYAAAHWLTFTLNLVRGNVRLYQPGIDDIIHILSQMNQQSTLVAISFHRYAQETLKLAEEVKKQGGFVISISDSAVAPIAEFSDILLSLNLSTKSTIDTGPALFSLINAIVAGVSVRNKDSFDKKRQAYESSDLGYFFL